MYNKTRILGFIKPLFHSLQPHTQQEERKIILTCRDVHSWF